MSKTNTGLVAYAQAQLGKPYWYGTFGQLSTAALYSQKKKQYPSYYQWSYKASELNIKVHDCVGLIKGYLWCDTNTSLPKYNSAQDVSATGMLNKCVEKGVIGSMPDIPGVLVFMTGHVGVYIGNGYVIEARGHNYGVVKTKLAGRGWKNWGKCPWITYETVTTTPVTTTPTAATSSSNFGVGSVVAFNSAATNYYPGGSSIPSWVKNGYNHIVTQTTSNGKTVTKGGEQCVLLGKKTTKTNGITTTGINTWVAIDNLSLISGSSTMTASQSYRTHTVVRGDTLWGIAKKYLGNGNRYKEIISLNGLSSTILHVGQTLKIPN